MLVPPPTPLSSLSFPSTSGFLKSKSLFLPLLELLKLVGTGSAGGRKESMTRNLSLLLQAKTFYTVPFQISFAFRQFSGMLKTLACITKMTIIL